MSDHVLSPAELEAHLNEQIGFLERSADAFDAGFEGEAKRLAVTLRVLLHDTRASRSLLGQLRMKDRDFADTADGIAPDNKLAIHSLIGIRIAEGCSGYAPLLDSNESRNIPFEDWWSQTVFRDPEGRTLSRRELVLTAADKDGGAHVDGKLTASYAALMRQDSLGWTAKGNANPLKNPERAAIRQIAHEVLKTLRPGYSKTHSTPGVMFSGMGATGSSAAPMPATRDPEISEGRMRFFPEAGDRAFWRQAFMPVPGQEYVFQIEIDTITEGEIVGVVGGSLTDPLRSPGHHAVSVVAGPDGNFGIIGRSTDATIRSLSCEPAQQ